MLPIQFQFYSDYIKVPFLSKVFDIYLKTNPTCLCKSNIFHTVGHDFCITWCSCRLTITRRLPLVGQLMSPFMLHLSSAPPFSGVHDAQSVVYHVVFFRLMITSSCLCLSVRICFRVANYPFDIFKRFIATNIQGWLTIPERSTQSQIHLFPQLVEDLDTWHRK